MNNIKKIYGFWHVPTIGDWQRIAEIQLAKIVESGLYEASDTIFVNIVGGNGPTHLPIALKSGKFSASWDPNLASFEYPTLRILQRRSRQEDFYGWYIHVNGATSASDDIQSPGWCWREYLEYFVLDNWRACLACLADHDTVGVEWKTTPRPHYSGNLWWADACYLRRLPRVEEFERAARSDRNSAQFWIGSDRPRAKCLHNFSRNLFTDPVKRDEYAEYADSKLFAAETRRHQPSRKEILRHVHQAGSDNLTVFGGMYEGGYRVQLVPEETADLIYGLVTLGKRFANYLQIGAAGGGIGRLLDDFLGFDAVYVIDDDKQPQSLLRRQNLPRAVEYVGDSHSDACRCELDAWNVRFDLVFVDGDNEYEGVKRNTELALSHANAGCLFVFHDTLAWEGVARWTGELKKGQIRTLQHRSSVGSRLGLEVFQYVATDESAESLTRETCGVKLSARPQRQLRVERVAVIFDNLVRPDTTGTYCRKALDALVKTQHFLPSQLEELSPGDFDLFLCIDDGLHYAIPKHLRPCAWWAIDTHMDYPWYRTRGPDFDFVFAAQRDGAVRLRSEGIAATWLPLACDPEMHRRYDVPKEFQLCFVGSLNSKERVRLLNLIREREGRTFIGQRFFEEMARTYSASRIVFNRSVRNDVNMRVFEALACGSLLLTNDLAENGQDELFRDGVHLATYANDEELFAKLAFYLANDDVRERIAAAGQQEAIARHTYRHRMETILGEISRTLSKEPRGNTCQPESQRELPAPAFSESAPSRLNRESDPALTSIVVLTHNQLNFTRQCVESVRNCTDERFEWIFVDNGSSDGTVEYLRALPNTTLIENSENRGVPAGFNQGIKASRGSCIVLLNNDVVVTPGWLKRMLAALKHEDSIGLVGPCLTWPESAQFVAAPYRDLTELDAFAGNWAEKHKGQVAPIPDLVGACLVIRREVIDRIGLFDEDFGIGQCEDNDFCRRAVEAGFRCVLARDAFVHHHGHRTFLGSHIDGAALFKSNVRMLEDKTRQRQIDRHLAMPQDRAGLPPQVGEDTRAEAETASPVLSPSAQSFHIGDGGTGFEVVQLKAASNRELPQRGSEPETLEIGGLKVTGVTGTEAEVLHTKEYLIRASRGEKSDWGLTSIVILTRNQLPYTKACLRSIRDRTAEPYELIVVDNGSTDGTVEYLRSQRDLRLIENPINRGFSAGCNQGIGAARGEHVVLLNNDTVVTTGWLDKSLSALHSDPQIGLIGPCTNNISGSQRVPVSYGDLGGLDRFAWEWGKTHNRVLQETERLVGFCLLFRRSLVHEIGLLDERFGPGNFEDDDFCMRARRAGYRCVIAREVFVHHFGSVTHRAEGIDYRALLTQNERLYHEKWAQSERETFGTPQAPKALADEHLRPDTLRTGISGPALQDAPIVLSLCMIVRDNATTLDAALSSAKPWVDELVVVDTGSVDETPEIAKRHGARVFHFPWCDDFSAARNESIRHARGNWIFWMDSDDTLDASCGQKLRALAHQTVEPAVLAYVMQVHCPSAGDAGLTVVDHVKMFRNRPDLRFDGRIHEQILSAVRRAGGEVRWTDIFVRHSGSDATAEGRKRKHARDLRLLNLELEERPDHPFTLFNLGMTHADMRDFQRAADFLSRSILISPSGDSHVRKAYALLLSSLTELGRIEAAWECCEKGLAAFPKDVELLFRRGILAFRLGRLDDAERAYLNALSNDDKKHFSSLDPGIHGFKARHNLAIVYVEMGRLADAEMQWRRVLEDAAEFSPGWRGLGDVLLRQGKYSDAAAEVDHLLPHPKLRVEGLLIHARISMAEGRLYECLKVLEMAVNEFPADMEPLQQLCQFLFEHSEPAEAEKALRLLTERDPHDPAARHNLGMALLQLNRPDDAVVAFHSSIKLRPNSPVTYRSLAQALTTLGKQGEAQAAFAEAERLSAGVLHQRVAVLGAG